MAKNKSNRTRRSKSTFLNSYTRGRRNNKVNLEALKRQKEFPELVCINPVYQPSTPETEAVELVSLNGKVQIYRTSLIDPTAKQPLYNILGSKNGQLYLTEEEINYHFDTSVILNWLDVPYMQTGFKLEDVKFEHT